MIPKNILYNPLLLYSFVLVSFGQFIILSINEEWFYIAVFVITCLLTSVFSKNLIVICTIGLCVLHILQHQYTVLSEGFGRKSRARRRKKRIRARNKRKTKRINKRNRRKFGGARRSLFGRNKKEKKRGRMRNIARQKANAYMEMKRRQAVGTLNTKIANASTQPLQATSIISDSNDVTGTFSEKHVNAIIQNNGEYIREKVEATKLHLNKYFTDVGNSIFGKLRNSTDLNRYKCRDNVNCGLYAEAYAREAVKEPLQDLYQKILHGPENDKNVVNKYFESGNIVN